MRRQDCGSDCVGPDCEGCQNFKPLSSHAVLSDVGELLPCPFCGGSVELNIIEPHSHFIATFMPDKISWSAYIECNNCSCAMGTDGDSELSVKQKVIEIWNTRANVR